MRTRIAAEPHAGRVVSIISAFSATLASSLGTLQKLLGDGALVYRPAANFAGAVTLTFSVSDHVAATAPLALSLVVAPVNDPPALAFAAAALSTPEDTALPLPSLLSLSDADFLAADLSPSARLTVSLSVSAGALALSASEPSTFVGNAAHGLGGGALYWYNASSCASAATLAAQAFAGNAAAYGADASSGPASASLQGEAAFTPGEALELRWQLADCRGAATPTALNPGSLRRRARPAAPALEPLRLGTGWSMTGSRVTAPSRRPSSTPWRRRSCAHLMCT